VALVLMLGSYSDVIESANVIADPLAGPRLFRWNANFHEAIATEYWTVGQLGSYGLHNKLEQVRRR